MSSSQMVIRGQSMDLPFGLRWDSKGRMDSSLCARSPVIGVDEVGRGCLAGPVVAAAVFLKDRTQVDRYVDSKSVSEKNRPILAEQIRQTHGFGVGVCSAEEVDELNILQASFLAMVRALENLLQKNSLTLTSKVLVMVDGHLCIPQGLLRSLDSKEELKQIAVIKGDQIVPEISAASLVAKVHRDEWMNQQSRLFPHYEWQKNKGYGSVAHRRALEKYGPTPLHRRSFSWKGVENEI